MLHNTYVNHCSKSSSQLQNLCEPEEQLGLQNDSTTLPSPQQRFANAEPHCISLLQRRNVELVDSSSFAPQSNGRHRSAFTSVARTASVLQPGNISNDTWDGMSNGDLRAALSQLNHDKVRLEDDLRMAQVENASLKRILQSRGRRNELMNDTTVFSSHNDHLNQSSLSPMAPRLCSTGVDSMILESRDTSVAVHDCAKDGSTISVILSQSRTVLSQINNQELVEKICAGTVIVKQLSVGNVVGYLASHIIKKFGKMAAGSLLGSLLLLKLAHHKGYISVDWNRIQTQIESAADENVRPEQSDFSWMRKKFTDAKTWSKENSYFVLGFWSGFLFHNLQ